MAKNICVSPKYGVNPSLMLCYCCGKEFGIALLGRLKGDKKAPHAMVYARTPCPECAKWMKQGIIFIECKDGESGDNPTRSGGWCVITEDTVKRLMHPDKTLDDILKRRICFVETSTWDMLGLPHDEATKVEEKGAIGDSVEATVIKEGSDA